MKKTLEERTAELEKRHRQLTARLHKLDAQAKLRERKRDARQKIVVGAAVIAHAKRDPAFAEQLADVLAKAVTRPLDRDVITGLLKPQHG